MTLENLKNLAKIGDLRQEPFDKNEYAGLVESAKDRLQDAYLENLSYASRFDLAYKAAHALALAALRYHGYRSDKRYLVFQCLIHTHCCPINSLSPRERVGVRGSNEVNLLFYKSPHPVVHDTHPVCHPSGNRRLRKSAVLPICLPGGEGTAVLRFSCP
jgi:hypothetical protein